MNTTFWHVMTSAKERSAKPASLYLITYARTENEAVKRCFEQVAAGKLLPMKSLGKYSVPDYTCATKVGGD